jgi:hypothetical protein
MTRGDVAMNVYSSSPPGPDLTHATRIARVAPMKCICSIQRGPPIIPNIISGRSKAASIVIAAIGLFYTLQLTFACQIMLRELAFLSPASLGGHLWHSVRLSHSFVEKFW